MRYGRGKKCFRGLTCAGSLCLPVRSGRFLSLQVHRWYGMREETARLVE